MSTTGDDHVFETVEKNINVAAPTSQSETHVINGHIMYHVRPPWATNLFSCFDDIPSVMEVMFCRWCQISRQYNIAHGGPRDIHWASCVTAAGTDLIGAVTIGVPVGTILFAFLTRQNLRMRYNLAGDDLTDLLVVGCCNCCAVTQQYREMSLRHEWPGGNCCLTQPYSALPPAAPPMNVDALSTTV